ncbi:hypothetical protein PLEOSDRAFT_1086927 [Pleurotus ostreatus PC15]|uniref:Uncharacterized protein n=1 Tax=Pleurotus ostreatus (strain PC15) TaxID=1137138 RepID=A0A067N2W0_PLEO1|nr:hypothetical protein PLEOSDRAFT_1086927 [Pleurotus ostreatus PC15]
MVYRGKNGFTGFAFEHLALSLHPSHSLLRYVGHGNYLLTDPDARSTKSFTIMELAQFVDTDQRLQRGQVLLEELPRSYVLLEELPRGYMLFTNVYNKEPLITTKFSTIDKHRNLVIGRGPSLRFLGITTNPPRRGRGYNGYNQIEPPQEDGLDGLERKILGMSVDDEVHDDFVMDGTPAPDYSVVAGPSSYDPMVVHQGDEVVEAPVENTEVAEDEGELTEDSAAAQDGDDTEDDGDV